MSVLESNGGVYIVCLLRDGRMFYVFIGRCGGSRPKWLSDNSVVEAELDKETLTEDQSKLLWPSSCRPTDSIFLR